MNFPLLFLLPATSCLIISKDEFLLKPSKRNLVVYHVNSRPFGFLPGANFTLHLDCKRALAAENKTSYEGGGLDPTLYLYLCPKGMHDVDEQINLKNLCTRVEELTYNSATPHKISWHREIHHQEFYQLVLKNMYETNIENTCSLSGVFLNPGGRHLSSDQMLIPTCIIVIIAVWMLLASFWLLNYIYYRRFSNKLHKLLTLIILVKLIHLCLGFINWTERNNKGRVSVKLHTPFVLCYTTFETLILMLLLLAAEGWCIIWESPRLLKYYVLLDSAFFLMDVCFEYVHKYFQGFAIVFASMMIYIAFKCTTISISTIKKNITTSDQFIRNHELTFKSEKTLKKRLNKKLRMFNLLQGLIIGLPCIYIVVHSIASFLLLYNGWVRLVLDELLQFAAILYCCALFRLQNFHNYNNIIINTPFHEVTVIFTPTKHMVYISNKTHHGDTSSEGQVGGSGERELGHP